jgi:hypothetical protein
MWESGGIFHAFTTCAQNKGEYSSLYPDQFDQTSTEEEDSGLPRQVWTLIKAENISNPCPTTAPSTPAAARRIECFKWNTNRNI